MKLRRLHLLLGCTILTLSKAVTAANLNTKRDDSSQPSAQKSSPLVTCPKNSVHTLLPHPSDCGQFFTCDHGVPHLTNCQKGLHFNAKAQACDYPETAGCKSDVSEVLQERDGGEKNNAFCPSEKTKHPVYKPHPTDCGKFYVCDGGERHLKVCQKGLHFNPKIQTCDYPRNAGCDSNVVTENPREGAGGCPAVNSGTPVYLPHKTDCRKFYVCDSGVAHLKVCQAGLHFNPKVNACDYPSNAGCQQDDSKKGPIAKRSLDNLNLCPTVQKGKTMLVSHPEDCSKFYLCKEGQQRKQECPPGLHFSPVLQGCDFPEKAHCKNYGRLLGVGKPSPLCPTIDDDSDPVFYRHPGNCSVYFMCSHGFAYEFQCPARLHFNLKEKICDYESTVNCAEGILSLM